MIVHNDAFFKIEILANALIVILVLVFERTL